MSIRETIQNELADLCRELDLDQVYGVLTGTYTAPSGRTCRTVTFCAARTIDGVIEIYGPKWIAIRSNRTGSEVMKSLDEAKKYMRENFG
jgi:hypothetical protein